MRAAWAGALEGGQGLAISHAEVDRLLLAPAQAAQAEAHFFATNLEARALSAAIERADALTAELDVWQRIAADLRLSEQECDLLSLLVAVELDPRLRRVCGYLNDDATACFPTSQLCAALFGWAPGSDVGADSALVRWRLARQGGALGDTSPSTAPWIVDPHVVRWILDASEADPALGAAVHFVTVDGLPCLYPSQLASFRRLLDALWTAGPASAVEINLAGPDGAGKRTLAAQFVAALGARLLVADAGVLLANETLAAASDALVRVTRLALLARAAVYWQEADAVDPRVWRAAGVSSRLSFFGTAATSGREHQPNATRFLVTLPVLERKERVSLWRHLTGLDAPEAIREWPLTPEEIARAARVAPAGEQAVVQACRRLLRNDAGELFAPLVCPYTWDDIVLAEGTRRSLLEFESQARLRAEVYDDWGFGKLFPLGRGITGLFAGPSGTGKTMAAQVLARSLGRELYRVDLAGVVNKYIGETEKRLKQVFDTCERSGAILLFDEADALFGQRTQVKDAQDRFANIEIDYLLQRMEQFEGVAILSTNRKGDLDQAFLRRLRFVVDFLQPGVGERLTLWRLALLERTPGGEPLLEGIDWAYLSSHLAMSGADIKLAALGAAFLARAEGGRIQMQHVLHAAQRELAKHGVAVRAGNGSQEAWRR